MLEGCINFLIQPFLWRIVAGIFMHKPAIFKGIFIYANLGSIQIAGATFFATAGADFHLCNSHTNQTIPLPFFNPPSQFQFLFSVN